MHRNNLVVVAGRVSSPPRTRQLPSGTVITQIEVTTDVDGVAVSVPVVDESGRGTVDVGSSVVVVGHVRRRFFRAGGVTQSRTEVVATTVLPATRKAAVRKALDGVVAALTTRDDT